MFGLGRSRSRSTPVDNEAAAGNQNENEAAATTAAVEERPGPNAGDDEGLVSASSSPARGAVSIAVNQSQIESPDSEEAYKAAAGATAAEASARRKDSQNSARKKEAGVASTILKIFQSRSFDAGGSIANFMAADHPMVLFSGDPEKVVAYDDERLTKYGWMYARKGTVLDLRSFWLAMFFYWCWAVFAGVLMAYGNGDASLSQKTETANTFNEVSNIISALLGFILGLYQSEAVARWWTVVNEGVYGIGAALQDNIMYAAAYLTDENDAEVKQAKRRIIQYCKYALALTLRRCAGHDRQFEALSSEDPLAHEERLIIEGHHQQAHNLIWGWMIAQWTTLYARKLLPGAEESLQNAIGACQDGRKATSLVDLYVNVQIPYEYYHLLVLIAKLFLIFFSMAQGITLQIKIESEEWFQFVIGSFVLFIVPAFYEGLLIIMYEIRNPFMDHPSDLDLDRLMATLTSQIDSYTVLPATIIPKHKLLPTKID